MSFDYIGIVGTPIAPGPVFQNNAVYSNSEYTSTLNGVFRVYQDSPMVVSSSTDLRVRTATYRDYVTPEVFNEIVRDEFPATIKVQDRQWITNSISGGAWENIGSEITLNVGMDGAYQDTTTENLFKPINGKYGDLDNSFYPFIRQKVTISDGWYFLDKFGYDYYREYARDGSSMFSSLEPGYVADATEDVLMDSNVVSNVSVNKIKKYVTLSTGTFYNNYYYFFCNGRITTGTKYVAANHSYMFSSDFPCMFRVKASPFPADLDEIVVSEDGTPITGLPISSAAMQSAAVKTIIPVNAYHQEGVWTGQDRVDSEVSGPTFSRWRTASERNTGLPRLFGDNSEYNYLLHLSSNISGAEYLVAPTSNGTGVEANITVPPISRNIYQDSSHTCPQATHFTSVDVEIAGEIKVLATIDSFVNNLNLSVYESALSLKLLDPTLNGMKLPVLSGIISSPSTQNIYARNHRTGGVHKIYQANPIVPNFTNNYRPNDNTSDFPAPPGVPYDMGSPFGLEETHVTPEKFNFYPALSTTAPTEYPFYQFDYEHEWVCGLYCVLRFKSPGPTNYRTNHSTFMLRSRGDHGVDYIYRGNTSVLDAFGWKVGDKLSLLVDCQTYRTNDSVKPVAASPRLYDLSSGTDNKVYHHACFDTIAWYGNIPSTLTVKLHQAVTGVTGSMDFDYDIPSHSSTVIQTLTINGGTANQWNFQAITPVRDVSVAVSGSRPNKLYGFSKEIGYLERIRGQSHVWGGKILAENLNIP